MVKRKTKFICQDCGYESAKWMGKCPGCQNWNTLVEEMETETSSSRRRSFVTSAGSSSPKPQPITKIERSEEQRISTHIIKSSVAELGSLVLV